MGCSPWFVAQITTAFEHLQTGRGKCWSLLPNSQEPRMGQQVYHWILRSRAFFLPGIIGYVARSRGRWHWRWRSGKSGASKHLPRTKHVSNHISWSTSIAQDLLCLLYLFAKKLRKSSPSPMTTGSATAAAQKRRRLGRAIANAQLAGPSATIQTATERKQCLDCLNMMRP